MVKPAVILERLLDGHRSISFRDFIRVLEPLGFECHPSAVVSLHHKMRAIGIFLRIAEQTSMHPDKWPSDSFDSFRKLYLKVVERNGLAVGTAPLFEDAML